MSSVDSKFSRLTPIMAAHFAGILDAFKGDDTLSGLDGSNGVVGTLFRAGDE
jgi:hypothetical protein